MERKVRDSCGSSGTGETPQALKRRGGSPPAPRKASILERKSTTTFNTAKSFIKEFHTFHNVKCKDKSLIIFRL
ncbi:hypothetical protein E2K98_23670 [Bacillus salipaludis]|uniref:Uncharacterized protein n=1 Tax=Bacillus salipaludis TaxID=2547811 RepID=A0A4R5VKG1_9BACI|nr:hypothetical protein E2K98_23670 [Bacillus salipaludis]